ncbi:hypothetical protein [Sandaracinus amylolyticus]|uniref:Lipoprotein n=1 Tax=Sandaracinus amylolyticus TaxID=927083 RepID=A0A0F6W4N5_9BACT|nr:hypothetical protein [Sandaracinus amylolyticus]AKF07233.1 hypothetical protein DB32_004382 [Sandaracinus amylolyticus]
MRARGGLVALLALAIAGSSAGCLRNEYDLCDRADPHPECDAGPPRQDASTTDAGTPDGGQTTEDAGNPEDSGAAEGMDAAADEDAAD